MSEEKTPALEGKKAQKESVAKRTWQNPYVSATGILFGVAAIVAVVLAVVNLYTKPLIDRLAQKESAEARALVLPAATAFAELEKPSAPQVVSLLEGRNDGVVMGYICEVNALGYKGYFSMLVGVDTKGVVTGVHIVTPTNETPGMGTRTEDPAWLSQFVGRADAWALRTDGGDVEAVSGATVSSRAVSNGVAAAVGAVLEFTRGGELS